MPQNKSCLQYLYIILIAINKCLVYLHIYISSLFIQWLPDTHCAIFTVVNDNNPTLTLSVFIPFVVFPVMISKE